MSWLLQWTKSSTASLGANQEVDDALLHIPDETLGLSTLYEPKTSSIDLDIVAVHGLGGDAFTTWTNKKSGYLWLRNLLPKCKGFENARIMTWGYDARMYIRPGQASTTARMFTFAESLLFDLENARATSEERTRPIIFIGHSLGGNVIKSALVRANNQRADYGDVLDATKSIFFFATPHEGADSAAWATYLGNIAQGVGIRSTHVIQELKRWSLPLVELRNSFAEIAPKFLIRIFFEQLPTHGVLVVPEMSARMEVARRAMGLNANHSQICKFESTESSNARTVMRAFESVIVLIRNSEDREMVTQKTPDATKAVEDEEEASLRLQQRLANLVS